MDALVVEQSFLQGDFLRADLLPCHILSVEGGQEVNQHIVEMIQVHFLLQHCLVSHTNTAACLCYMQRWFATELLVNE